MQRVKTATEALASAGKLAEKPQIEDFDRIMMQSAVEFSCAMKSGSKYWVERWPTLCEAAACANNMEAVHPAKRANVYAIIASGSQVLVPRELWKDLLSRIVDFIKMGGSYRLAAKMKPNYSILEARAK